MLDLAMTYLIRCQMYKQHKKKIYKLDFTQMKKFYVCRTLSTEKRPPKVWGKYLQSTHATKALISRICREFLKLNSNQKTNNLNQKWTKYCNRNFSKDDIQMASKDSYLSVTREMQIKHIVR